MGLIRGCFLKFTETFYTLKKQTLALRRDNIYEDKKFYPNVKIPSKR